MQTELPELKYNAGDGYGLSKNAIQSIHDKGCQLIVTVDNGIAAIEEAEFAASDRKSVV